MWETGRKSDDIQPTQDMTIWDNLGRPLTRKRGRLTQVTWFCGLAT